MEPYRLLHDLESRAADPGMILGPHAIAQALVDAARPVDRLQDFRCRTRLYRMPKLVRVRPDQSDIFQGTKVLRVETVSSLYNKPIEVAQQQPHLVTDGAFHGQLSYTSE